MYEVYGNGSSYDEVQHIVLNETAPHAHIIYLVYHTKRDTVRQSTNIFNFYKVVMSLVALPGGLVVSSQPNILTPRFWVWISVRSNELGFFLIYLGVASHYPVRKPNSNAGKSMREGGG